MRAKAVVLRISHCFRRQGQEIEGDRRWMTPPKGQANAEELAAVRKRGHEYLTTISDHLQLL
jgi:hypothetical protein